MNNYVNSNKKTEISEKDLVFGFAIGIKNIDIKITVIDSLDNQDSQKVLLNFYYLKQPNKAYQIYLSTYPNDVFSIGHSPDGFDVCRLFNEKLISYWDIPGETVYYETNAICMAWKKKKRSFSHH